MVALGGPKPVDIAARQNRGTSRCSRPSRMNVARRSGAARAQVQPSYGRRDSL